MSVEAFQAGPTKVSPGLPPKNSKSRTAVTIAGALFALVLSFAGQAKGADEKADPYVLLDQIGESLQIVEEYYFEPADQADLLDGAIRGMLGRLDPHSSYLSREDREIFEGSTAGRFGGIGVEVEFEDGHIVVIAPVEGSPADRAGIRPGDEIVALDGRPLSTEKPYEIVRLMRGVIGTKLRLTIRGESPRKLRDVIITREEISVASVLAENLNDQIAYFRIKAFQEGTHREFLKALGKLRASGGEPKGIILDLRNNPGGLVREATAVADEFLSSGTIYSTRHREQVLKTETARRGGAWVRGAVVVLVNEFSASAAELVAGALKDSGRAHLVGARTFGKGSVQTLLNLGHGGALKLTTALYYTPSGRTTQATGVTPHLAVDPGYVSGPMFRVLKESDLDGHVLDTGDTKRDNAPRGAPPTNKELHLGVARNIPKDPNLGPDVALKVAYDLVRGEISRRPDPSTAQLPGPRHSRK
jgi:carboxyl-terminal processing protease